MIVILKVRLKNSLKVFLEYLKQRFLINKVLKMKISLTDKSEKTVQQNEIITKICELVNVKNLELGDRLPSERLMSEKFDANRNQIREAIRKLEFYGVVRSIPQSATVLNIGLVGFNKIMDEIVELDVPSFKELVETRITLELKTVCLAAARRTEEDLKNIRKALNAFRDKVINEQYHLEEDLLFHIEIAKASKNNAMLNLMLLITPSILVTYDRATVCKGDDAIGQIQKHENIYKAIESKDSKKAVKMMEAHFYKLFKHIE